MSVSPLDYRYGRNEAKAIWSRDGRHSRQLAVERALVSAHMEMGRVSEEHDEIIGRISSPEIVTADRVDEIEGWRPRRSSCSSGIGPWPCRLAAWHRR